MASEANLLIGIEPAQEDLIGICSCIESALVDQLPDQAVRQVDCRAEINILESALEDEDGLFAGLELNPPPHVQLAAFALWKLTDLCSIDDLTQTSRRVEANVLIASASTALQLAAGYYDGDMREKCLGMVATINVSDTARKRVRRHWSERDEHRAFGLALAKTIDHPSRAEVARQVVNAIFAQYNKMWKDETVDGWLKDAGHNRSK
jgi:hypothetical protein